MVLSVRRIVSAALLSLVAGVPALPPSAGAATTSLCTGYAGCARAGMPSAGYAEAGGRMYWRMYAGHNCTNYVAYRMVRSGMADTRPWSGSGNATYWGTSMRSITDQTPAVGAVAWWKANVSPAGSSGHVAYVEKVVSADEIIVSQDSWGGDFSWARVTRGRGWPSGFVHFNDTQLLATSRPAVSGTPRVGSVVRAVAGAWSQTGVATAYQWRVGGVDVPGATGATLTLTEAMVGRRVRVSATGSRLGLAPATALSDPTAPVQVGSLAAVTMPVVTGAPRVGAPLTASSGAWNTVPESLGYAWLADGVPVAGAGSPSFVPGPALLDRSLAVRVTARKAGYADAAVTVPVAGRVSLGLLEPTGAPALAGAPRLGGELSVRSMPSAPGAEAHVQWLRAGRPVPGATAASYPLSEADLGARVRAVVTLTREAFEPVTMVTGRSALVKSEPDLAVRSRVLSGGRIRVTVRATAAGVERLDTHAELRSGGRHARARMSDGRARFTLNPPGRLRSAVVVLRATPSTTREARRIPLRR